MNKSNLFLLDFKFKLGLKWVTVSIFVVESKSFVWLLFALIGILLSLSLIIFEFSILCCDGGRN